jgi:hypothetical protein
MVTEAGTTRSCDANIETVSKGRLAELGLALCGRSIDEERRRSRA